MGGVAIYVKSAHNSSVRKDLTVKEICMEALFIELKNENGNDNIIGVIYRRPKTDFKLFIGKLICLLNRINKEKKTVHITGDFNINLVKQADPQVLELTNVFNKNFLCHLITKPTRVNKGSASHIDHIWSNDIINNIINVIRPLSRLCFVQIPVFSFIYK